VIVVAMAGFLTVCIVAALAVVLICECSPTSRKSDRVKIMKVKIDRGPVFGATGARVVSV
jgi:hypothetical protein